MRMRQSPGVEITERDLSQYNPAIAGTTTLIMGFADKGEDMLPLEFTSRNSWLTYYGIPSNEAERYFYNASMEVINQSGRLITAKIPYDNDTNTKYLKSVYSVATSSAITSADTFSAIYNEDNTYNINYKISNSVVESITSNDVDNYRTGADVPSADTFEIVDITRQKLTKDVNDRECVATFNVVSTVANGLAVQNMLDSLNQSDYNALSGATTSGNVAVTSTDIAIPFASSDASVATLSKQIAELYPTIVYDSEGGLDSEYMNQIQVTVVRMFVDANYGNKINFSIAESFVGSLNKASVNPDTNESIYIGDIINGNSNYIEFYSNVSDRLAKSGSDIYTISNQSAGIFGFTTEQAAKDMTVATITQSINTIFDKLGNIDEIDIDIVTDAGLSNITSYIDAHDEDEVIYSPNTENVSDWTITSRDDTLIWRSTAAQLINFAQNTRKDCIAVIDGMRPLVIEGSQKIVRKTKPSNTIDANILSKAKYITGINSSYGAGYMDWFSQLDEFSGTSFWCPPSIKATGAYIYTDRTSNFWEAPAGLNRGVIYSANDIAFNPNPKQAGAIYTKGWNYAINYPYDGIVLEGQKTLQTKPSAFDRVNVRRMFLRLERAVYKIARYYVYEGNTSYVRQRFVDQITPIFEDVKLRGGLYSYKIICDTTNNTPEVIDQNTMKCSILLKPTKTAEYICVQFTALRTGSNFSEVIV